jgi:RNA polymerase sigma-70 factor (ECF subfamily)
MRTAFAMLRGAVDAKDVLDPDLIARIRDGESSALGLLFDRYDRDIRRLVSRLGVQPADVDDVVQATFLDVLAAAGRYDGRASAKGWLMGLAVIHVRRHRRSLSRLAARIAAWGREPRSSPATPEESAATRERTERARRALDGLSEKKREVLVLVTVEGLSGEEVAGLLGIPVATVWTRLHHARRELQASAIGRDK